MIKPEWKGGILDTSSAAWRYTHVCQKEGVNRQILPTMTVGSGLISFLPSENVYVSYGWRRTLDLNNP